MLCGLVRGCVFASTDNRFPMKVAFCTETVTHNYCMDCRWKLASSILIC